MNKYKLHSCGENWFHFRTDIKSTYDSFSVTYCHDGTVCMTGDMGCLSWIRHSPDGSDYGFPYTKTGIDYFAEKIVRAEEMQKIRTWKKAIAEDDIKCAIKLYTTFENEPTDEISALTEVLEELDMLETSADGQYAMISSFMDREHCIEYEDINSYGECYTDSFQRSFEMLQSVSGLILAAVQSLPDRQFNIHGYELLEKVGKPRGNSGMVHVPVGWIGEDVVAIRVSKKVDDD